MTEPAVILDANVYRAMAPPRFDALLELERRRQVARYAEPFALAELLAHLVDPQDRQYARCRPAVGRVYRRCGPGGGGTCGIIRDSESRLAEAITGKGLKKHDDHTKQLGILLTRVVNTPAEKPLAEDETLRLRAIAEHVREVEAGFADTMRRLQTTTGLCGSSRTTARSRGRPTPRVIATASTHWRLMSGGCVTSSKAHLADFSASPVQEPTGTRTASG